MENILNYISSIVTYFPNKFQNWKDNARYKKTVKSDSYELDNYKYVNYSNCRACDCGGYRQWANRPFCYCQHSSDDHGWTDKVYTGTATVPFKTYTYIKKKESDILTEDEEKEYKSVSECVNDDAFHFLFSSSWF